MMRTIHALGALLALSGVQAQSLHVHGTDGTSEEFPVAHIRSIKFGEGAMHLHLLAGGSHSWPLDEIRSYDLTPFSTSITENTADAVMTIHPNPSNGPIRIAYQADTAGPIVVDILDISGRALAQVYTGTHAQRTLLTYDPTPLGPGLFVCRITDVDGFVHTKFQVQ